MVNQNFARTAGFCSAGRILVWLRNGPWAPDMGPYVWICMGVLQGHVILVCNLWPFYSIMHKYIITLGGRAASYRAACSFWVTFQLEYVVQGSYGDFNKSCSFCEQLWLTKDTTLTVCAKMVSCIRFVMVINVMVQVFYRLIQNQLPLKNAWPIVATCYVQSQRKEKLLMA